MPKQRITKEMVVDAAFELARQGGMEQVIVKNIAEKLGCSVQPIYSYCNNMDGLRNDVENKVRSFLQNYIAAHIDKNDLCELNTNEATNILINKFPKIRRNILRRCLVHRIMNDDEDEVDDDDFINEVSFLIH